MKHKHDVLTYRRFVIGWIGSHLFCTVIFFVFHSLCFVGGTFGAGLRYGSQNWLFRTLMLLANLCRIDFAEKRGILEPVKTKHSGG